MTIAAIHEHQSPTANEQRSTLPLLGLEADNLLAFLALLGLLRAIESAKPNWQARVVWCGEPLTAELHLAAAVPADQIVACAEAGIRDLGRTYEFDRTDIAYKPEDFRRHANEAQNSRERARLIAALASDGATRRNGESVEPSPLCAMFGQGHQHFLSRLAAMATRDHPANELDLRRALLESWRYEDETDGFRWDPIEDRRYAHQYGDPSENKNKIGTVTGANRLASIGFAVLTSVPTLSGLVTLGVVGSRRERDICWPLVALPTSLAGHLALLADPRLGEEREASALSSYGVGAIARSRRYQVGKFFNFERARILMV